MKNSIIVITVLIFSAIPTFAAKIVPLPGHLKPFRIRVDREQIFIAEGPEIFIYSAKDFTLQTKFGKPGEGPREFKLFPEFSGELDVQKDTILVSSLGKISFFTRDGKFIREKKAATLRRICLYRILDNRLVGEKFLSEGNIRYLAVNLYDTNLKKIKEIHRNRFSIQRGKQFNPIDRGTYIPNFYIQKNRIFIGGEIDTGTIHVFDREGKKLDTIKPGFDKIKFTAADKKGWIDSYISNAEYKRQYERIKDRFKYPEYFPLWQSFIAADKKIYVQTFKRDKKNEKNEFFMLTLEGKLIKKVWLPLAEYFDFSPNPYTINSGKLYQFVENEESEEYELHIVEIK